MNKIQQLETKLSIANRHIDYLYNKIREYSPKDIPQEIIEAHTNYHKYIELIEKEGQNDR